MEGEASLALPGQDPWDHLGGTPAEWYGKEQADKITFAEAFEIRECGREQDNTELRKIFPVFPERGRALASGRMHPLDIRGQSATL